VRRTSLLENSHALRVAIIDYEMCNLFSVHHTCLHVGLDAHITSDISLILESDGVILPGVGAFGDAMENLKRLDLISPIKDFISSGKPFMGICLGMQLLMSESEEFGNFKGLGIINGPVVKFPSKGHRGNKIKVPQVGWNTIYCPREENSRVWEDTPLKNIRNGEFMYFVHSFYVVPSDDSVIMSYTRYEETEFCSSMIYKNIAAFQFHPEKSAGEGIRIYRNWFEIVRNNKESRFL
jgi:glutamine amidotransferase